MANVPHDISDLHLAPVVIALDARIDELSVLDLEQLTMRVAVDNDNPTWTVDQRQAGLLEAVKHVIDCHGWTLAWDPRGIRVSHETHSIVLGVPVTFVQYLAAATPAAGVASTV